MGFNIENSTGNIGNVPLVLIAALCRDPSNPFAEPETCSTQMTAYISFGQWVCFRNSHFFRHFLRFMYWHTHTSSELVTAHVPVHEEEIFRSH